MYRKKATAKNIKKKDKKEKERKKEKMGSDLDIYRIGRDLRSSMGQLKVKTNGITNTKTHSLTMVENRKKHRINSHPMSHCPTSSEVSEVSEQASERVSGASEQANGRAIGPVLQSVFLVILAHSAMPKLTLCVLNVKESPMPKHRLFSLYAESPLSKQ